ncbi:LysR substrate-binding domain-containing protein [Novosphingobium sp. Rr 2-17]|uniref:LysR substrate-binding domain-containing protein n=1 Tax=Novosphingobium sp. Rr 2-17 TaxID=555793 RepID=UPI001ED8F3B2|nr:LysR substrate-binding domain-containing protein [Novosphingobium sp. Rr 2-17]
MSSLRAFEAVARRSSFKAAAEELSVTPSAVSHQIRQLEAHVGVRLLDRTPRGVSLTQSGQLLRDATSAGFEVIGRAIGQIRGLTDTGMLTLTSTAAFLSHWLVPRLASLRSALPTVELRFHASDMIEPLHSGRIDVAIRYGRGPFPGTVSHKLHDDELIAVCSPGLRLSDIRDLRRTTLIHIDGRHRPDPAPNWTRWCAVAGLSKVDTAAGLHLPDSMSAVQAAIAGQGIVIVSRLLVADAISSKLLVQPFACSIVGEAYHFAAAADLATDANVGALREWFVKAGVV